MCIYLNSEIFRVFYICRRFCIVSVILIYIKLRAIRFYYVYLHFAHKFYVELPLVFSSHVLLELIFIVYHAMTYFTLDFG